MTDNLKKEICVSTNLSITSHVINTHEYRPLTGVYSLDTELKGWEWDKRLLESNDLPFSYYDHRIGGHDYGLKDGTKLKFWQSGSILRTDFLSLSGFKVKDEFLSWTPVVGTGIYSIYFEDKFLYSDFSFIDRLEYSEGKELPSFFVREDGRIDSLSVCIYERDKSFINWPCVKYKFKNSFTGKLTDELVRLETEKDGIFLKDNLSDRHKEYTVRTEDNKRKVILNDKGSVVVGKIYDDIDIEEILCSFEDLGSGNIDGRDCFLRYFPVEKNSLKVFEVDSKGNFEELTEVQSLKFSKDSDPHYSVDYDLGIIRMGGYKANDLVLAENLDEVDDEISCFNEINSLGSYPSQGIIKIGNEEILYHNKGYNKFQDCIRGYNGTEAVSHEIGTIISDIQHGKGTKKENKIYVGYKAVPRIEYEVTESKRRTANRAPFLDVKAISNAVTNNIVQINPTEIHVSDLVLEADSPLIAGNLHGPLFYGTDHSKLTARATDSNGNPVEGIDITIVLDSPVGYLNSSFRSYTARSNSLGEIYAFYNAPYDWDSIKKDISEIFHKAGNTFIKLSEEIPPGVVGKDVQLYQVLKHDRFYGTVGDKLEPFNWSDGGLVTGEGEEYGSSYIDVRGVFDDSTSRWESLQRFPMDPLEVVPFHEIPHAQVCPGANYGNSYAVVLLTNAWGEIKWVTRKIIHGMDLNTWSQNDPINSGKLNGTRLIFNASIVELNNGWFPKDVWAVDRDSFDWNAKFLDGVPVVLYEWNEDVLHPVTGEIGAYHPVRPDIVSKKELVFMNKLLPLPEPYNRDQNLGGYLAVCSDMVKFYAYCKDPVSGRQIISNEIRIRLDIPPYLQGVHQTGSLPIPYGFGFVTEEFNIGTGLGGANFLTINPVAEGIDSFSINVNTGI